jgi:hypothetical protein
MSPTSHGEKAFHGVRGTVNLGRKKKLGWEYIDATSIETQPFLVLTFETISLAVWMIF